MTDRQKIWAEIETDPVAAFIQHAGASVDTLLQRIPAYMQAGLVRYIVFGIKPGSFLTAIVAGEKHLAAQKADASNAYVIPTYFALLAMECPSDSWGSPEKVREWVKRGGIIGKEVAL